MCYSALLEERAVIALTGDEKLSFLQGLVTNSLSDLEQAGAKYAGLLTPQGKILFDFLIVQNGDRLLLDAAAELKDALIKRLTFYKLRSDVEITDLSSAYAVSAGWDGASGAAAAESAVIFSDPRHPKLGTRCLAPADAVAFPDCETVGAGDYQAHRIALAIPEGGQDWQYGDAFPHEACWDFLNGVSFTKGCYVGQEVVSRMQHKTKVRTRVVTVSAAQPLPPAETPITAGKSRLGALGSSAGARGLALVRLDRAAKAVESGEAIMADGVKLTLETPEWADFTIA